MISWNQYYIHNNLKKNYSAHHYNKLHSITGSCLANITILRHWLCAGRGFVFVSVIKDLKQQPINDGRLAVNWLISSKNLTWALFSRDYFGCPLHADKEMTLQNVFVFIINKCFSKLSFYFLKARTIFTTTVCPLPMSSQQFWGVI